MTETETLHGPSGKPMPHCQPVLWWQLITDMETFSKAYGWGLANVWTQVKAGDYQAAYDLFDEVREAVRLAHTKPAGTENIGEYQRERGRRTRNYLAACIESGEDLTP